MDLSLTPGGKHYAHEKCFSSMYVTARNVGDVLGTERLAGFQELGIDARALARSMAMLDMLKAGSDLFLIDMSKMSDVEIIRLLQNKVFLALLSETGPIARTKVLDVINPASENGFHTNSHLKALTNLMLPKEFLRDKKILIEEAVRKILSGKYPGNFFFKPGLSADGNGIVFFEKTGTQLKLSFIDPSSDRFKWDRNDNIEHYLKSENSPFIESSEREGLKTYTVDISEVNKKKVSGLLCNVLLMSLYVQGERIGSKNDALTTGLIEAPINKLDLNGKAIEARYFAKFNPSTQNYELSHHLGSENESFPSYMKHGNTATFVNSGTIGGSWPDMHDELRESLGLQCTKEEFNQYIEKLICSHAYFISRKLTEVFNQEEAYTPKLEIDIVWEKGPLITVPKADGSGIIQVPKPLVMELRILAEEP